MNTDPYYLPTAIYLIWLVPIISFTIFFFRYQHNKVKLVDGIWFNLFFYSLLISIGISIIGTRNTILIYSSIFLFGILLLLIGALFAMQAFLWIWNGILMWRRESHSLANTLTLIIGVAILIEPLVVHFLQPLLPTEVNFFLTTLGNLLIAYILMWAYNFLTVSILYQFNRPKLNQDYIVVLGSGLINGDQVPPLLAARIDRALAFYQKQLTQTGKAATLIFSGGQGPNEATSEGQAMLAYAIAHGLPESQGIAETKSVNTYQNMRNSKAIIEQRGGSQNTIFVTNNYHTYRAGRMAQQAGLKADGIGAKTSWFFIPDALIRESVAIFLQYKWWHVAFAVFAVVISGLLTWINIINH